MHKLFNTLKSAFTFPVDPNYRVTVEQAVVDECYPTQRLISWVILLFQAFMIASSILRGYPSPRRRLYLYLYITLFVLTIIFTIVANLLHHRWRGSVDLYLNFSTSYAILLSLWSSIISLMDQYNTGSGLSVFTYVNMSIAVFIVMRPWQCVTVFGGSCLVLNLMVVLFQDNPLFFREPPSFFGTAVNSSFMSVMAIFVSITFGHYRVKQHYDKILIEEQYEEICVINERLNLLAMTDQLTHMGNRHFLEKELQQLRESGVVCVTGLMLDIDFFKQFNDHYGHQAGDLCLQEIASVIMEFVRVEGAFAVRYGGEEFFLCLPGNRNALEKAETLRRLLEERRVERDDLPGGCVTVSIGVDVEEDWTAIGHDAFLHRCDQALYEAKNGGRNRVALYRTAENEAGPVSQTKSYPH